MPSPDELLARVAEGLSALPDTEARPATEADRREAERLMEEAGLVVSRPPAAPPS
ncbi:MAG: hypothetical protein ACJ73S_09240 [Mycobacteriales bacterium]